MREGPSSSGGGERAVAFAGWCAQLRLGFDRGPAGTRLARALHEGPLRVQRPFHPEGPDGACHVYVLHPPGGIVGGDRLGLEVDVQTGASALLTMPGANKLYRARPGTESVLRQRFTVGAGALLEWLPQETIAFAGARARTSTEVTLAPDARYVGWEIVCLGRPAAGERFTHGELRSDLSIRRDGRLTFVERARFVGGDALLGARWGLADQPVIGTLVVAAPEACAGWVDAARTALSALLPERAIDADPCAAEASDRIAVTLVSGVLVVRYLGASTRAARGLFERAFAVLRPLYAGRPAVPPRIWST